MVCRRSTTPITTCSGLSKASLEMLNFIFLIPEANICLSIQRCCVDFLTERPLLIVSILMGKRAPQQFEILLYIAVFPFQLLDLSTGVQDSGVVTTAKGFADLREAVVGQFLGQRHRHLARSRYRSAAPLGKQIRELDLVVFGHHALDVVYGDQLVLERQ